MTKKIQKIINEWILKEEEYGPYSRERFSTKSLLNQLNTMLDEAIFSLNNGDTENAKKKLNTLQFHLRQMISGTKE